MLFDQFGRPIPEASPTPPVSGVQIISSARTDRDALDASRGLIPARLDMIMIQANSGDIEAQCKLCRELPEKNHDIAHALRTRRNALVGCRWEVEPGDKSPAAAAAAEALKKELLAAGGLIPELGKIGSFRQLLRDLCDATMPGFAASEIVWKPGGSGFYGFRPVEQKFFSFSHSYTPRLRVTGNLTDGIELPRGKIIYHETGENGPDPVRGGLIRPLAWLHCFSNLNFKDLLSFIERYGMPFVVAKVDANTWETEGEKLNALISDFGPNGGGVFSKGTELELLQAANNTGDVYFRLLDYAGAAITKVILGQTASSSDGGGLSKDNAQSEVRQDILEADARQIEDTINRDLFAVWAHYNCAPGVAAPTLAIQTTPGEDTAALATTLANLYNAGLQADPAEMSERFGFKLERKPDPVAAPVYGAMTAAPAAEPEQPVPSPEGEALTLDKKAVMYGTLIRGGVLTPTRDLEEKVRADLGLPPLPAEAAALWDASGGVRKPLTIKDAAEPAPETSPGTVEAAEAPAAAAPLDALRAWFGPLATELAELADEGLSDNEFDRRLAALAARKEVGDSTRFEALLAKDMEAAYQVGAKR